MKIACYTDIHNQQIMLNYPATLRGSAIAAAELTKKEWGKADLVIVGGDNISDYPHWNRSCALPYKNWLDIKSKMVDCFAAVAKDERVLYVDGNNDLILGDLPTSENPPYNTCDFYHTGPMKETLGILDDTNSISKYAKSKGEGAGLHYLCFHYVVDGIDFFGLNIDPDSAYNTHDGYYNRESLEWLSAKLDEIDPNGDKLIFVTGHLSATTVVDDREAIESMGKEHTDALYDAFNGHRNLFYLYGHVHGQGFVHAHTGYGVLHFDENKNLLDLPGKREDSREVIKPTDKVGFNTVHIGGLRPFLEFKDGKNLYFEDDGIKGKFPWEEKEQVFSATATPKLAQYMLIETFEDRVTFMFRNTGTYEGFSVNDIPSPYTVYLK